jgi:hypothetical protein
MKIYSLVHSINETMSPCLETSYFLNLEDGKKEFNIRYSNVGEDYETIHLEELDTDSMTAVSYTHLTLPTID